MVELSKYTDVFENGTVKAKDGQTIASRHALHVIAAMTELVVGKNKEAMLELIEAGMGRQISQDTVDLLGSAAASILEQGRFMTQATAAIIGDIVKIPTTNFTRDSYYIETRHYDAQFDAQAEAQGTKIVWDQGRRPVLHNNSAVA